MLFLHFGLHTNCPFICRGRITPFITGRGPPRNGPKRCQIPTGIPDPKIFWKRPTRFTSAGVMLPDLEGQFYFKASSDVHTVVVNILAWWMSWMQLRLLLWIQHLKTNFNSSLHNSSLQKKPRDMIPEEHFFTSAGCKAFTTLLPSTSGKSCNQMGFGEQGVLPSCTCFKIHQNRFKIVYYSGGFAFL